MGFILFVQVEQIVVGLFRDHVLELYNKQKLNQMKLILLTTYHFKSIQKIINWVFFFCFFFETI